MTPVVITFERPAPLLNMNDRLPARNRPRAKRGQPAATFAVLLATETDECVTWPHAADAHGYGRGNVRGRGTEFVYAVACELRHGVRPDGLEAAHSCGVPACMNYRHLRWATQSSNMADRVTHGASNRGERNGGHRLTADDVRDARRRYASGETQASIAARLGVPSATVQAAVVRRSWFWLED